MWRMAAILVGLIALPQAGVAPAGAGAPRSLSLGPTPVDCGTLHKDYADSSCLTQTYSHLTISPHVVHAGGSVTATVALSNVTDRNVEWRGVVGLGQGFSSLGFYVNAFTRCSPTRASCTYHVPKKAGSSPWQIVEAATHYGTGTGISKDYFAVIGAGQKRLSGRLADSKGKPLADVRVTADGPQHLSAKTDVTGTYNFALRAGRYVVSTGSKTARPIPSGDCRAAGKTCRVQLDRDRKADFGAYAPLVLRYRMLPRLIPGADGMIQYPTEFNPDTFPVAVTVEQRGGQPCQPQTYSFKVDGTRADATASTRPCEYSIQMRQGKRRVEVQGDLAGGEKARGVKTMNVRDFLVVGLGDSVGSGEGNPDIPATLTGSPRWQDPRCDRSANSFEAKAARGLEYASGFEASVTFLHLACSGAGINQGVTGEYWGIVPGNHRAKLIAQISQMVHDIGSRKPDAVIVSIGANDIGFGNVVAFCAQHPTCFDDEFADGKTLDAWVAGEVRKLPGLYATLARHLESADVPANRVYITQYFDPTRDANGKTCSNVLGRLGFLDAQWAYNAVMRPLNVQVATAARQWNWHLVSGAQQGFRQHGYCSTNSWIVPLGDSLVQQHDKNGTMHPNRAGHDFIGQLVLAHLMRDLLPHGKPRPLR